MSNPPPDEDPMRRKALEELLPHTLPKDAPGAWIRARIEAELAGDDEPVTEIYVAERRLACGCVLEPERRLCAKHAVEAEQ